MAMTRTTKALVELYLKHLQLPAKAPSFEYLCEIQKKHIETIPHENIDNVFHLHSSFDIPHLLNKYIVERRGGFCFELNYSLAWLLKELGFHVELILANVVAYEYFKESNTYPTHPIIIVYLGDKKFLTDAGWCDSYRNPISLTAEEYNDHTGKYRVVSKDNEKLVMQKWLQDQEVNDKYDWNDQFIFNNPTIPVEELTFPVNFLAAHVYTHVGVGYIFSKLFKFTSVNPTGHQSIWGNQFLTKKNDEKNKTDLTQDVSVILQQNFNVAPQVATKCIKFQRSASMLFSYKPLDEKSVTKKINAVLESRIRRYSF
jgi:arylamine N-acetyltransferase